MASPKINKLRSLSYYIEPETSYGVNVSGSQAYTTLRFSEASFATNHDMLDNQLAQQYQHGNNKKVVGRKRANVTVKSHLYGAGTALDASTAPSSHDIASVLGVVMGGLLAQSGTTAPANAPSSGTVYLANRGVFPNGALIGALDASGKLEVRKILSSSMMPSSVVGSASLHSCFSFIPQSAATFYNGYLCYLASDSSGSLQFYMKGAESVDSWVAVGCNGGFSLENVLGQLPNISFNLNGASWFTASAGNLLRQSYGSAIPPVFKDSRVTLYRSGALPAFSTEFVAQSVTINPNVAYTDVDAPSGVENIQRKVLNPCVPTLELQGYLSGNALTHFADWESGVEYGCLIQIGSAPGRTVAISLPRVQITDWQRTDTNSLAGIKLSLMALDDTYTVLSGSAHDDLGRSPLQIGFF